MSLKDVRKHTGKRLLDFVARRRPRDDWHEPDEQGIGATFVGKKLDNAEGDLPYYGLAYDFIDPGRDLRSVVAHELLVVLRHEDGEEVTLNLASVLALATAGAECCSDEHCPGCVDDHRPNRCNVHGGDDR